MILNSASLLFKARFHGKFGTEFFNDSSIRFLKLHIGSYTFDTPSLIFFEKRPLLAFHIEDYIFFLSENDNIFSPHH